MARIYTSSAAPVPIYERSIFTHLFVKSPGKIGGFPADHLAFIDAATGTALTRAQLKRLALAFGHGLRHHTRLHLARGDTVLIFSPNSLAWPVVLFGAVAAGLRCTLANNAYTAHELGFQYTDSSARLVLTPEENVATVRAMFAELGYTREQADALIVLLPRGLEWAGGPAAGPSAETRLMRLEDLLATGALAEEEKFTGAQAHETVYLCYSSGTTGKPKGVETTHQNVTSVVDMSGPQFIAVDITKDVMLGILPFYHVFGAINLLNFPFSIGMPVVIQTRFEPVSFCANIARYRATAALVVPPVLVVLARHPAVDQYDLSSLTLILSSAAPLSTALVHQVTARLRRATPPALCAIIQGYGLTETSPSTHMLPLADAERKIGSVGQLLPNLEARLVAVDADGAGTDDAAPGERGELWVRGPTIMKGYLNNPAATADAITPEGWFRTGDIAVCDADGYYYIVDRRKELIKYKGFQVPPAELEAVLLAHPDIADAAVIGVYSAAQATELPRAYVVPARPVDNKDAFARDIVAWLAARVAPHKQLRGGVVPVDAVPKSAAGKILRRELRERAKGELGAGEAAYADPRVKTKL